MSGRPSRRLLLWQLFLLSWVALLVTARGLLEQITFHGSLTVLYAGMVYVTYCATWLLPVFLAARLLDAVLSWRLLAFLTARPAWLRGALVLGTAVLGSALIQLLVYSDAFIHRLYGFHLYNGFVLNLLTTPGGIESMGGSDAANRSFALIAAGYVVLQAGLLALLAWRPLGRFLRSRFTKRRVRWVVALFLVLGISERLIYGVSNARNNAPVLAAATVFPLYHTVTFRKLAKRFGFGLDRQASFEMNVEKIRVRYPLAEIRRADHERWNIVWLVAESWRADQLDPEIMPATWAFSERACRFEQHYSGSNSTRMGMFSMFYGLYGPYWFPFLQEKQGPLVMDVLIEDGYQLSMYTSANFRYPEFDKTVFSRVPPEKLHESGKDLGWRKDRRNVSALLEFLDGRDRKRPFMTFMFFESPHARYYFPPESVIRKPYLEEFNYATADLERDMPLIKNRYVNACHHLDSQFARILSYLEEHALLEQTMVILTGDHGEEFMESGRWGHGSTFSEQQTRVPLVLWIPGEEQRRVARMTSHLDLPATLLPRLGVANPPEDYSLGFDLLGDRERAYTVVAHWHDIGYIDKDHKALFPALGVSFDARPPVTTKDDEPVADAPAFFASHRPRLLQVLRELKRFGR